MKYWKWGLAFIIGTPIGLGIAGLYMLIIMGNYPLWMWLVSIVGAGVLATGITKFCDRRSGQQDTSDENLTIDWKTVDFEAEAKQELNKSNKPNKAMQVQASTSKKIVSEELTYDRELENQIFADCFANAISEMQQSEALTEPHTVLDASDHNNSQNDGLNNTKSYDDLDPFDVNEIYFEALQSYVSKTKEENGYQKRK